MKKATVLVMLAVFLVMLVSCSLVKDVLSGQRDIYTIIPATDSPYWQQVATGMTDAGFVLQAEITVIPYEDNDPSERMELINEAVRKKPDALVIVPFDDPELKPALESAGSRGTKIIFLENTVEDFKPDCYIRYDYEKAGGDAAAELASLIEGQGNIVHLNSFCDDSQAVKYELGVKKELREHPGITLINTFYCEGDKKNARLTMSDILTVYPDIHGLIVSCPNTAAGAVEALKEWGTENDADSEDRAVIVCFDRNNSLQEGQMENLGIFAAIIFDPYRAGYTAVETADELIKGNSVQEIIDLEAVLMQKE